MSTFSTPCFRCQQTLTPAQQCTVPMPDGAIGVCPDCVLVIFSLHTSKGMAR